MSLLASLHSWVKSEMHELAVTESILKIAIEHAERAGADRIMAVHLVIGDLSSIVDESVEMYFQLLAAATIASGASLQFHRVKTKLRCRVCGGEYAPDGGAWICPHCGAADSLVEAGREFFVESIEVP